MIKKYLKIHAVNRLQSKAQKRTLTLLCVVDTFLLASKQPVNVLSLNGNTLLPYVDGEYTQRKLLKIIDNELPLLIYNAIICDDIELLDDINVELDALETSLKNRKKNEWVKLLLKSAFDENPITNKYLLSKTDKQAQKFGADRAQYNTYCAVHLETLKKLFKSKKQCKSLCDWLNNKKQEVQLLN
ncbi:MULTISPECIES: hypothetical protein [Pseudoalteromonas]|uniref:hypothetical protein n=1 Tax=Pseudoalteromonas TaxID=53246 RepID=UPI0015833DDE|nr:MULTISPECIES: hypothetical protein [Pseudoalteromonas]MDI4654587.1 hypothetical protein [Pseudoalteromonas shioyasakiensis]NUJ40144.1 hypothetical protein [Pseudoalteromonas sp. 0303]